MTKNVFDPDALLITDEPMAWKATSRYRIKMHPSVGFDHTHQQLWVNVVTHKRQWRAIEVVPHDTPNEE
jgi:hypothetical protein